MSNSVENDEEFIKRMEEEYYHQIRNGRDEVYIDADDLNRLGYGIDENKKGRTWADAKYFKIALDKMKFKTRLKVKDDTGPIIEHKQQTYREFMREIRNMEKKGKGREDD